MIPSINERLDSLITSVRQVILPALADSGGVGAEQAGFLLIHLQLLRQQVDDASRYEQLQLRAASRFADRLADLLGESAETGGQIKALREACLGAEQATTPATTRAALEHINLAVNEVLQHSRAAAETSLYRRIAEEVLSYTKKKALDDRAFFAGANFEFDPIELPSIPELMLRLETEDAQADRGAA